VALAGDAFLALWNDIAAGREAEYDQWHTREHVPERVAVAGFAGARRYVQRARATRRYFTLYEVADEAVLAHAEYADLVQHPTPWSASMRPDFRHFVRAACRVRASVGEGIGAALAIACYVHADAPRVADAVDALRQAPGVVGCHLGERAPEPPPAWVAGARDAAVRAFDRVLLIEALDREAAAAALAHARALAGLAEVGADSGGDVYDLAFIFPGHAPHERLRHRRAHWDP
jgi:hypothetical protein